MWTPARPAAAAAGIFVPTVAVASGLAQVGRRPRRTSWRVYKEQRQPEPWPSRVDCRIAGLQDATRRDERSRRGLANGLTAGGSWPAHGFGEIHSEKARSHGVL